LKALVRGQFYIRAEPIRPASGFPYELFPCTGDNFEVYISAVPRFGPELPGRGNEFFHNDVRVREDPGGKEKSFYIITAVKFTGEFYQFINREGSPGGIRGRPVNAIGAVKAADIGVEYLEKADTAAVAGP
jgi:hypothetical protein